MDSRFPSKKALIRKELSVIAEIIGAFGNGIV
jgi:hypothetical protein